MHNIIITKDDTKYQTGKFLMLYDVLDVIPDQEDTTYILRVKKVNEQVIKSCLPYLKGRLIISCEKLPKLSKDMKALVNIENDKPKVTRNPFFHALTIVFKETDRLRAYQHAQQLPIPLSLSYLKSNVTDIEFFRTFSKIGFELNEQYTHALIAYGVKPSYNRINPPKKREQEKEIPSPFRRSDRHWKIIISNSDSVANQVRIRDKDKLPKGVRKSLKEEAHWV